MMDYKDIYILMSVNCECHFIWQKGPCSFDCVKDLEIRLSGAIESAWYNHRGPYKEEAGGIREDLTKEVGG